MTSEVVTAKRWVGVSWSTGASWLAQMQNAQRLDRIEGQGPGARLGGEFERARRLVVALGLDVAVVVLVEQVPEQDARIGAEVADDAFDVALQGVVARGVGEDGATGRLHPAGVVHVVLGLGLLAGLGVGVPARVEEHEHGADVVAVGDRQVVLDALQVRAVIGVPRDVVQEHAHDVEAQALGPAQLLVDGPGVPGLGLPHLQLADRGARHVVGAGHERLLRVPGVGHLGGPLLAGLGGTCQEGEGQGGEEGAEGGHGDSWECQGNGSESGNVIIGCDCSGTWA